MAGGLDAVALPGLCSPLAIPLPGSGIYQTFATSDQTWRGFTLLAPFAPGAPLCRAHAAGTPVDGLEVNFKGGQVGAPDYFLAAARGHL